MAVLCFCFSAFGQTKRSVDLATVGIQVGQVVPDVALSGLHNYRDGKGRLVSSARLSDFRGKLLILDFWATWCSPCVAMMPKMDSLQGVFGDRVQFLSVSYQQDGEVLPFVADREKRLGRRFRLPMLNGDQVLRGMFPHVYLPHYVWIGGDGRVLAVSGLDDLTTGNIERVLSGGRLEQKVKRDVTIAYDKAAPLFGQNLIGPADVLGYYFISKSKPGLPGRMEVTKIDSLGRIRLTASNYILTKLYQQSYTDSGLFDRRNTILEVRDTLPIWPPRDMDIYDWRQQYGYCYERVTPKGMAGSLYTYMRQDLRDYFPQYQSLMVRRKVKCLALVRLGNGVPFELAGSLPSKLVLDAEVKVFQAVSFKQMLKPLFRFYLQHVPYPIVDDTGYQGLVNIKLNADLKNVDSINAALRTYGLKLAEKELETEVLIIRDAKR